MRPALRSGYCSPATLTEEHRTRARAVNLHVTRDAVGVLGILVVLRSGRFDGAHIVRHAMARQAELIDRAVSQQSRIRRTMGRVTSSAAFGLHRRVFVRERTLLVGVTLDTCCISARRQPGLFQLKPTMRVVTIAATHRAFENLVMERHIELRLHFAVTAFAKLRVARPQHASRRKARFLSIDARHVIIRTGQVSARRGAVRRVAVGASDVVAPVFATSKIVAFLFARMACQTSVGGFLRRFVFKRNDLRDVTAAFDVRLARSVTRFASGHLVFPVANLCQFRVRSM